MTRTPHPQPGNERAADRDDSRGADADRDADDLVAEQLGACHAALKHIADCIKCRQRTFEVFVKTYDPDTWALEHRLRQTG
jgi:hypothetical protein